MLMYELYDPLAEKTIAFFFNEIDCHKFAEGLSVYEIVTCVLQLTYIKRIVTQTYENNSGNI